MENKEEEEELKVKTRTYPFQCVLNKFPVNESWIAEVMVVGHFVTVDLLYYKSNDSVKETI